MGRLYALCAVKECNKVAHSRVCFYDGQYHSHGCIHYNCGYPKHSVAFREDGWYWVCDDHYNLLKKEREAWVEKGRRENENKRRSAGSLA